MTWHPIDDPEHPPPKDGTEILVGKDGWGFVVVSYEWTGRKQLSAWSDHRGLWDGGGCDLSGFTHWMPIPHLPPPPKDDGK